MEKDAQFWIDHLQLQQHPEGGYFKETYRAEEAIAQSALPDRYNGKRSYSTAIYFLLRSQDISAFHQIQSDEGWFYHAGGSLTLYVISPEGGLTTYVLGPDAEQGEQLQLFIPAQHWFGAKVNEANSYTLMGCTVAPGFDFADFELAERDKLLQQFPQHKAIINELTH